MKDSVFRFKQFNVAHDKCAMKVNTDGVLLGSWAVSRLIGSNPTRIIDIGTGTGVIALMMAQNFSHAEIDAIDIDADAAVQAKENFESSVWAARLHVEETALQHYKTTYRYNVVVSNPPYFVDDYKTGNQQKDVAKHSTALSYEELVSGLNQLLTDDGMAFLVIPVFNVDVIKPLLVEAGLYITSRADVVAVEGKLPYLSLLQLERKEIAVTSESIVIHGKGGGFTEQYRLLTKDYYLKF